MRKTYEKPRMVTEKVEPQSLVACGSPAGGDVSGPIQVAFPWFGFCCQ